MTTTVIDVKKHRIIATVPAGDISTLFKQSIFTSDGNLAYVTNNTLRSVDVIDVKTHKVIPTIQIVASPTILTFGQ
ncbi:YncE family protein [Bacillus sp. SCS-151]|uniref:YncE family protein n=1 Tax=Nanhaiella sioensis TaxID=3115293 RepID=UPI00397D4014